METYEFSGTFELGSLLIEPVHVRIEELRPVIAAHAHSNTSYEIHYTAAGTGSAGVAGSLCATASPKEARSTTESK